MRSPLLVLTALVSSLGATGAAAQSGAATPESLLAAAKRAAGLDYQGTFTRICVMPRPWR